MSADVRALSFEEVQEQVEALVPLWESNNFQDFRLWLISITAVGRLAYAYGPDGARYLYERLYLDTANRVTEVVATVTREHCEQIETLKELAITGIKEVDDFRKMLDTYNFDFESSKDLVVWRKGRSQYDAIMAYVHDHPVVEPMWQRYKAHKLRSRGQ